LGCTTGSTREVPGEGKSVISGGGGGGDNDSSSSSSNQYNIISKSEVTQETMLIEESDGLKRK